MFYLSIYEHSKVMYQVTVWLITDYTYNGSSRRHTIMASLCRYLPGMCSHNVKSPIWNMFPWLRKGALSDGLHFEVLGFLSWVLQCRYKSWVYIFTFSLVRVLINIIVSIFFPVYNNTIGLHFILCNTVLLTHLLAVELWIDSSIFFYIERIMSFVSGKSVFLSFW